MDAYLQGSQFAKKKEWHVSHLYHTEESLLAADLNGCYCYICIIVVHVPHPVLLHTFEVLQDGKQVATSDKAFYAKCVLACFKEASLNSVN